MLGSKCRRRSTRVERSVESLDTLSEVWNLTKHRCSVFNQLPELRLERVFGDSSALFESKPDAFITPGTTLGREILPWQQ